MQVDELRPIPGFEGRYGITRDGRVWSYPKTARGMSGSVRNLPGRWLTPTFVGRGYLRVDLSDGSNIHMVLLHRAVAMVWGTANASTGPQINHINGIKTDIRPENLEWCDVVHNVRHSFAIGLHGPKTEKQMANAKRWGLLRRKLTAPQIVAMRADRAAGVCAKELAAKYDVSINATYCILRRDTYNDIEGAKTHV